MKSTNYETSFCDFRQSPVTFSLLGPNMLPVLKQPQSVFSNTLSLCSQTPSVCVLKHPQSVFSNTLSLCSQTTSVCVLKQPQSVFSNTLSLCSQTTSVCVLKHPQSVFSNNLSLCSQTTSVCVLKQPQSVFSNNLSLCSQTTSVCVLKQPQSVFFPSHKRPKFEPRTFIIRRLSAVSFIVCLDYIFSVWISFNLLHSSGIFRYFIFPLHSFIFSCLILCRSLFSSCVILCFFVPSSRSYP
jgi:hypothetical protein